MLRILHWLPWQEVGQFELDSVFVNLLKSNRSGIAEQLTKYTIQTCNNSEGFFKHLQYRSFTPQNALNILLFSLRCSPILVLVSLITVFNKTRLSLHTDADSCASRKNSLPFIEFEAFLTCSKGLMLDPK